jgi:hypothetical protein
VNTARPVIVRPGPAPQALADFADIDPILARLFVTRGARTPAELD